MLIRLNERCGIPGWPVPRCSDYGKSIRGGRAEKKRPAGHARAVRGDITGTSSHALHPARLFCAGRERKGPFRWAGWRGVRRTAGGTIQRPADRPGQCSGGKTVRTRTNRCGGPCGWRRRPGENKGMPFRGTCWAGSVAGLRGEAKKGTQVGAAVLFRSSYSQRGWWAARRPGGPLLSSGPRPLDWRVGRLPIPGEKTEGCSGTGSDAIRPTGPAAV